MSYDLDAGDEPVFRPVSPNPDPQDLEVLVGLLEVAAILLTEAPDSTFTEDELVLRAMQVGGAEVGINDRDARIVLRSAKFVARAGGGRLRLR